MKKIKTTSERIAYTEKCPVCKKEIKGFSKTQLEYNMRLHKEAHEKEKKL